MMNPTQVKARLEAEGVSVAEWARAAGKALLMAPPF